MQIIVVSNSLSKRIEYFVEAGKHLQTEVCFMTYEELFNCLPLLRQAVIKLEPCVSDETDFLKYALLNQAYKETLQRLSEMSLPDDVCFLNTPDALLRALDKKETKEVLMDKGLKVTPMLPSPQSFDELRQLLADCGRGCFLKPRYGSGAGGIMAIRYQPNRNKWVVYTTLRQVDGVIHNTKRINRLSVEKEIIPLAEAVIQTEAILEEWIPKAQLQGENYDLRVVCRESEIDYIVVRCSKGSITNLHLNNKAHWWNELSLSEEVRQQIYFQCQEAVQSLDLRYAGVDVLIERGTDIPYIIEVNGQGDHVYQDMFAHNSIYTQQIKNIKRNITMQIDELPAGEQTCHPDLDMNQVVGTHDILMLCFDTLRYDVSKEEEAAGRTPVLNSHGGEWEKRHAPGNFTYPSHFAIFAGFLPSPAEPHSLRSRNWLFFPVQAGTGRIPPKGSYPFTEATFVQSLAHTGYETICIGGVNFFSKRNELGRVFPGYFTKSYWLPTFGCTAPDSTEKQIDFALKKLENYPDDKRIFMYINFSAIHYPNCHYVKGKMKDDKESHAAALQYIDSQLPRLFQAFQKRSNTLVIALSDHGTCYGEDGYEYHCISHETVYTVPYKHFILTKQ